MGRLAGRAQLLGLGVAGVVLLLGGLSSAAALAAKSTLDFTYGFASPYDEHQLEPGGAFDLWNTIGVTFEADGGYVRCVPHGEAEGFVGVDATNDQKVDTVDMKYPFGLLTADGLGFCESDLFSEAQMAIQVPTGATLTLSTKGLAELNSTSSGPYEANVFFGLGKGACYYTFKKLKGVVFGGYTEIDFDRTKLKFNKTRSSVSCPKTADLELPFNGVDNKEEQFFADSIS